MSLLVNLEEQTKYSKQQGNIEQKENNGDDKTLSSSPEISSVISESKTISTSDGCSENSEIDERRINWEDIDEPIHTLKMLNICKDLILFSFIVIVTYAALNNEQPKISKSPAAYPFFGKDSPVIDWYRGHLSDAIEHAKKSDLAFIMYYAPWDAESQHARKEFEEAARHMERHVAFGAVNCWHPTGECHSKYNKVYGWPVFIVYPTHGRGIQYTGPAKAEYMIKFLYSIIFPIKPLDLSRQHNFRDAFVTIKVNPLPGSLDYAVAYTTALKYLEKDPYQSLSFYVQPQARELEPSLSLHMWNETLIYPIHEKDWRPDAILKWLGEKLHSVSNWVAPTGMKSSLLSSSIYPGPSFILFTPYNPLRTNNDYYQMLQEIGMEYYNCSSNNLNPQFKMSSTRLLNLIEHETLKKTCNEKSDKPIMNNNLFHISTVPVYWLNNSIKTLNGKSDCANNICLENLNVQSCILNSHNDKQMTTKTEFETSMIDGSNDERSIKNIQKLFKEEQCKLFHLAERYHGAIFENRLYEVKASHPVVDLTGMACKTNRTLSFTVMDSLTYYHFAEKLGIDLFRSSDKSGVAIINEKDESHYILEKPINSKNIRNFIKKFTTKDLDRSFKSLTSIKSKNTHSYAKQKSKNSNKSDDRIIIDELNSKTFLPTILQENKAVVVFYYSKQCSYCNGISYVFLTVALQLQNVKNIQFARIDGELNILPWEFTMDTFPTVIYFPPHRKSDSVAFPSSTMPITVSNLIGFLLSNLDENIKLNVMWTLCNQTKFEGDQSNCLKLVRAETLTLIAKTLKRWRSAASKRQQQVHLYRLQQLKQLHLQFAYYAPKHRQLIDSLFAKLNSETIIKNSDYYNK